MLISLLYALFLFATLVYVSARLPMKRTLIGSKLNNSNRKTKISASQLNFPPVVSVDDERISYLRNHGRMALSRADYKAGIDYYEAITVLIEMHGTDQVDDPSIMKLYCKMVLTLAECQLKEGELENCIVSCCKAMRQLRRFQRDFFSPALEGTDGYLENSIRVAINRRDQALSRLNVSSISDDARAKILSCVPYINTSVQELNSTDSNNNELIMDEVYVRPYETKISSHENQLRLRRNLNRLLIPLSQGTRSISSDELRSNSSGSLANVLDSQLGMLKAVSGMSKDTIATILAIVDAAKYATGVYMQLWTNFTDQLKYVNMLATGVVLLVFMHFP